MTDLVASVRLKADGSGLVGQAREASAAVKGIGTAAAAANTDARALAAGTGAAGAAIDGMAKELQVARAAAEQFQSELRQSQQAAAALAGRVDVLETQLRKSSQAHREGAVDANRHAFGVRNLGQQFGDLGLSIAGGISPARAFGQQAGQVGYALSEMGGRAGKLGAFLTGPWGVALTVASAVLAPFVESLFEGGQAADAARTAADSLADRVGDLGNFFDLTTGKIKETNKALLNFAVMSRQAKADAARDVQKEAQRVGNEALADSTSMRLQGGGTYSPGGAYTGTFSRPNDDIAQIFRDRRDIDNRLRLLAEGGSANAKQAGEILRQRATFAQAARDIAKNDTEVRSLLGGVLDPSLRTPSARTPARPKASPKAASTVARDEFGRDAADKLADLTSRFDATPAAIQKTNREVRQLDDLIDDLSRKKPPGFEQLIASAEAAKITIRTGLIDGVSEAFAKPRTLAEQASAAFSQLDAIAADLEKRKPPGYEQAIAAVDRGRDVVRAGLVRPFDEYVAAQEQSLQIGALVAAGRRDEADALRTIVQLERQMGPLTDGQKAAVLETTQALAAQERQVERLHRRQQVYLNALNDVQGIVAKTIFDGPQGLKQLPGQLADAFKRFSADRLAESLFGDAFEKLRDQVKGTRTVEDASRQLATAFKDARRPIGEAASALDSLAVSARAATGAVASSSGAGAPAAAASIARAVGGNDQPAATGDDIVVVGRRKSAAQIDPFAGAFGQIATVLGKKIGIDDAKAEKIGSFIGGTASKGLRGAVEGQAAASVAGMLGIKTSQTGAAIGGAIGSFIPIPGGQIIGGLVGGIVGGLFKKTKTGSATIGAVDGEAGVTGTSGTSSSYRAAASGAGAAVSDSINSIIQQLGGTLGSFAVSIGQRGDKYVVDNSGRGSTKYGKANDGVTAYKTIEEAQAAALANALADGAVKGVSAAVARALQSSDDVTKAVNEALKVQQLETLLGGVSGQLTAVFKQFDSEATERVRLAKKYGLDLLQVEKINAEQRATLIDQTLSARITPLKDLLASLTTGDLFEGTATERRTALRAEIDKASVDAANGVEGATDRVAQLLAQLVTTTKNSYGTAGGVDGEFGADRAYAASEAARLIKIEEDRVRAAAGEQAATTKAVEAGNQLVDEGNDLAAINNGLLQRLVDLTEAQGKVVIQSDSRLMAYRPAY